MLPPNADADSALINPASPTLRFSTAEPRNSVFPYQMAVTTQSVRARHRSACVAAIVLGRRRRPRSRAAGDMRRRLGQRPAGAALRQPQVRPGQCARRAEQGPGRALGLYPRRHAGRDHRRVRELAAHPRLGRRRRLGLSLAAVRQAHRRRGAAAESGTGAAVRERGPRAAAVVARLQSGVLGALKSCDGQWCQFSGKDFSGYIRQDRLWGAYPNEKGASELSPFKQKRPAQSRRPVQQSRRG